MDKNVIGINKIGGLSTARYQHAAQFSNAILNPTPTLEKEVANALSHFKPYATNNPTLDEANLDLVYYVIYVAEKKMAVVTKEEQDKVKGIKNQLDQIEKKIQHFQMENGITGPLAQSMMMADPQGKELSTEKERLLAEFNRGNLPSLRRKTRLYHSLLQYYLSLGYTNEQLDAIFTGLYKLTVARTNDVRSHKLEEDTTNNAMGAHLNAFRNAYKNTYIYTNPLYYLVPGLVAMILGLSLFTVSLVTGQYPDYTFIFGTMGVGGFLMAWYGNKYTGRVEFEYELNEELERENADTKTAAASSTKRLKSRETFDIFSWETGLTLLFIAVIMTIFAVDMWFLGGALSTLGQELVLTLIPDQAAGGWGGTFNGILLMAIAGISIKVLTFLPKLSTNPAIIRFSKQFEESLQGNVKIFGLCSMAGMALTSPILATVVAGLGAAALTWLLYVKYIKKDNNNFELPGMGSIPINKLIMYAAIAAIGGAVCAAIAFTVATNPFVLSVGVIVAAVFYFGGFKRVINAYASKKDIKNEAKVHQVEMKEMKEKEMKELKNPNKSTPSSPVLMSKPAEGNVAASQKPLNK